VSRAIAADPDPEIHPAVAARHAAIVATGRSGFPNQSDNVLAFPGVSVARSTPGRGGSPNR
jgi:malic enzyme